MALSDHPYHSCGLCSAPHVTALMSLLWGVCVVGVILWSVTSLQCLNIAKYVLYVQVGYIWHAVLVHIPGSELLVL